MRSLPAFVVPVLVVALAAPVRASDSKSPEPVAVTAEPSPSVVPEPSPSIGSPPPASPVPTDKPDEPSRPTSSPSPSPTPSSTATAGSAAKRSGSPSPLPSKTPLASPSATVSPPPVLTEQDRAALALLEDAERLVPGLAYSKEQAPLDQLAQVVEAIRLRLAEAEGRLARWQADERAATARLAHAERRADEALRALEAAEAAVRKQAGDFYMAPAWSGAIVFAAGDLEDAGRARGYMTALMDDRVDVVLALREARRALDRERSAARTAAQALSRAGARIQGERALLGSLSRRLSGLLDHVVRSFGTGSAAFARIIADAQKDQPLASSVDRTVYAPLAGRTSSPFGPRVHPIYGYRSLHTGLDIAAPAGAPVVAPRDGIVLAAGFAGPFGLTVVLDHGNQIASVLSHLSAATVRPGDRVVVGDEIGLVGCTGWCTGPHLHFEVWLAGRPQDPAAWLIGPATASLVHGGGGHAPESPARAAAHSSESLAGLKNPLSDSPAGS